MDKPLTGLAAAVHAAGGTKADLAKKLGLTRARISQWRDEIPVYWILRVEQATGVHRSVLCPNLFGTTDNGEQQREVADDRSADAAKQDAA